MITVGTLIVLFGVLCAEPLFVAGGLVVAVAGAVLLAFGIPTD